jgi:predicted transcriptional regulator
MISIDLDPTHQQRLDSLAKSQGQDGATLARRVLMDYLDFQALPADSDADWAEASIAMSPEVMGKENWDDPGHES